MTCTKAQLFFFFFFCMRAFVSICLCVGKFWELNIRLRSESEKGLMAGAQLKKSQKWSSIILHTFRFLFGLLKSFSVCLELEHIKYYPSIRSFIHFLLLTQFRVAEGESWRLDRSPICRWACKVLGCQGCSL